MNRHIPLLLSTAIIAFSVTACSSAPASSIVTSSSSNNTTASSSDSSITNSAMTQDEAKALFESWKSANFAYGKNYSKYGAYYVKTADDGFSILAPAMKSCYDSSVLLFDASQSNPIPSLSRSSGDSLVLFSDSNSLTALKLCASTATGYTYPLSFDELGFFSPPYAYNVSSGDFSSTVFDPDSLQILYNRDTYQALVSLSNATLDGQAYNEICSLPNAVSDTPLSCILSVSKGDQCHVEYYKGTDFGEGNVSADYFYIVLAIKSALNAGDYDPDLFDAAISLTKNGYAEVDISDLLPGYYAIPVTVSPNGSAALSPFVVFQIID